MLKSKEERKQGKEQKKQEKLDSLMRDYNLEHLSQEDKEAIKLITYRTWGTDLIAVAAKPEDDAKITSLQALIEQNWVIIKLLNEIDQKLDK